MFQLAKTKIEAGSYEGYICCIETLFIRSTDLEKKRAKVWEKHELKLNVRYRHLFDLPDFVLEFK